MKVVFFAQSRQAAGCGECHLEWDHSVTSAEFWARLVQLYPGLASIQKTARLARHENYLAEGDKLNPRDEIAVIPPVSGG
jgi:molybdopterin converting factor small subunit